MKIFGGGPSYRNSIMMSNHAEGFKHLSIKTKDPIKLKLEISNFKIITGRLENSGYTPPRTDYIYAGSKLYIPKITQIGLQQTIGDTCRVIFFHTLKLYKGFSVGIIRWVQMYSDLLKGRYWWMEGNQTIFLHFQIFLEKMTFMKIMKHKLTKLQEFF